MSSSDVTRSPRRFELDWLRVGAILMVFVFHSCRFFDTTDWHVKNATTYFGVQVWVTFLANWLMPVIFVVSGSSLFLAMRAKSGKMPVLDKVQRLLVPLLVGVFSHAAVGVYLERITHHQFVGSLSVFLPYYFQGWYGFGGNFAWMGLHLWYLLALFVYSLLCYPLFRLLLTGPGERVFGAITRFLALPGAVYVLALPVAYLRVALDPSTILGMSAFGGWPLPTYLLFYIYGFIIITQDVLSQRIRDQRWWSLAASLACLVALLGLWATNGDPRRGTARYELVYALYSVSAWCWTLTFFGFALKHCIRSTPFLAYANEAVLPFYIMHQPVLLAVGYAVTRWAIPDLAKFLLISAGSFVATMLLYELVVRRWGPLRVLFGMKLKR